MKEVILTCGPRGAGKSSYCEKYIALHPEFVLVSRDLILKAIFGTTTLDSYSGGHFTAMDEMFKQLRQKLSKPEAKIILDCWNGYPDERRSITRELRRYGAERIEAWRFITPEETVVKWMLKREHPNETDPKHMEWVSYSYRGDYKLYHSFPLVLEQGFDLIREIDPTQLNLFGITH